MSTGFLFTTVPQTGHTMPLTPFAAELVRRGHRVRWYTGSRMASAVTATGAEFLPMRAELEPDQGNLAAMFPDRDKLSGLAQARFDLENIFVRPAGEHVKALLPILRERPAQVIVGDTWAVAASWLNELTGVPAATIGVNPLLFPSIDAPPAGLGMAPISGPLNRVRNRLLNLVVRKIALAKSVRVTDDVRESIGLSRAGRVPLVYAAQTQLYLQLSPPGFEFSRTDLPEHLHFLGHPAGKPATQGWDQLRGKKVVLVTQGTVAVDPASLLRPAIAGLADQDVVVIAVTGGAPVEVLGPLPANVIAEPFIPFDEILPHVDVMVTNGGFGGVQRAIAQEIPLVVAGLSEDKKDVNVRVAHSGVGIDLKTDTPTPKAVSRAVATVLGDSRYREAVARVHRTAPTGDPTARGTDLLEQLAVRLNEGTSTL